jgi:dipeptidyl aminopeptidase/acylaminoacyl peptidase
VIYDPTMTQAIYPRFVAEEKELLTYGLWDMSNNELIASFENIFAVPAIQNNIFPSPHWSPDGSQFVFEGAFMVSDTLVQFELYRVNREGQIEQLTHLTSLLIVDSSNLSWSPDGRYLAIFLNKWGGTIADAESSRLAVLDMETLQITDYCIQVSQIGVMSATPLWSPGSTQLLITDLGYSHVILVDLVQGFAAQIAQNMEAVGWMLPP